MMNRLSRPAKTAPLAAAVGIGKNAMRQSRAKKSQVLKQVERVAPPGEKADPSI